MMMTKVSYLQESPIKDIDGNRKFYLIDENSRYVDFDKVLFVNIFKGNVQCSNGLKYDGDLPTSIAELVFGENLVVPILFDNEIKTRLNPNQPKSIKRENTCRMDYFNDADNIYHEYNKEERRMITNA